MANNHVIAIMCISDGGNYGTPACIPRILISPFNYHKYTFYDPQSKIEVKLRLLDQILDF